MNANQSRTAQPAAALVARIVTVRGPRAMIDADLAPLYGVTTKRLNEQVRRNRERFPSEIVFQLSAAEKAEVVANCDHLARLRFSPTWECSSLRGPLTITP